MKDARDLSIEELEALILQKKQQQASLNERLSRVPTKKENIDFSKVIELAQENLNSLSKDLNMLDDFHFEISDQVMFAVFGEKEFKEWYSALAEKKKLMSRYCSERW